MKPLSEIAVSPDPAPDHVELGLTFSESSALTRYVSHRKGGASERDAAEQALAAMTEHSRTKDFVTWLSGDTLWLTTRGHIERRPGDHRKPILTAEQVGGGPTAREGK